MALQADLYLQRWFELVSAKVIISCHMRFGCALWNSMLAKTINLFIISLDEVTRLLVSCNCIIEPSHQAIINV